MQEISIYKYIDDLKSSKPTPGGGSAVSINAMMGLALICMAYEVTRNRKSFTTLKPKVQEGINETINMISTSIESIKDVESADQDAFDKYMLCLRAKDEYSLKAAQEDCFDVPARLFGILYTAFKSVPKYEKHIVSTITSDYVIGLRMIKASLLGCIDNMAINVGTNQKLKTKLNKYKKMMNGVM